MQSLDVAAAGGSDPEASSLYWTRRFGHTVGGAELAIGGRNGRVFADINPEATLVGRSARRRTTRAVAFARKDDRR
jgi:hypothetical protein